MRFLLVLGILAVATSAQADRHYVTEGDAVHAMFPAGVETSRRTLELSDEQLMELGKALDRKIEAKRYPYLDIKDAHGGELGVVFMLDVIGQSQPITFAIGVASDGTLRDVAVMVYRESHGDEITDRRFRRQFVGKTIADPISLGKDVDAITGATISSRSATFAARKGLQLAGLVRATGS